MPKRTAKTPVRKRTDGRKTEWASKGRGKGKEPIVPLTNGWYYTVSVSGKSWSCRHLFPEGRASARYNVAAHHDGHYILLKAGDQPTAAYRDIVSGIEGFLKKHGRGMVYGEAINNVIDVRPKAGGAR